MANSDVDLNEQAQKAVNEIQHCCEAGVYVPVAAVAREYEVHKN